MAKAQAEILGIALVIVLLIIGLLLVVRFMLTDEESDLENTVLRTQIGTNIIHSLLKTSDPNCDNLRIEELFIDCADHVVLTSGAQTPDYSKSGSVLCRGISDTNKGVSSGLSCAYAKALVSFIFVKTLDEWRRGYEFNLIKPNSGGEIILIPLVGGGGCKGKAIDTAYYPIPTTSTTISAELKIC